MALATGQRYSWLLQLTDQTEVEWQFKRLNLSRKSCGTGSIRQKMLKPEKVHVCMTGTSTGPVLDVSDKTEGLHLLLTLISLTGLELKLIS